MEGWRKNGIQAPSALYWIQRYNGARYIGVTVYYYSTTTTTTTATAAAAATTTTTTTTTTRSQ
ncbi:hypothetical protein DPMN_148475 [Dreissena polymorpha]|uniref:Uncharacterized protein n=1 Tax=Dreissena polymorpha TaxID=45954 RepID=A0A9D4F9M8_DREPO|nr:hypothetical protein DPMN_148475 [Dreissena polymorpha]